MSEDSKVVIPANARLCHVIKSDDFDGYGFNLHAEKGKPGQYIGKVDEGSPAEVAGLRQGDRILEVNGVSIRHENHKQVVQRIKALSGETKLLVVDPDEENMSEGNGKESSNSSISSNTNSKSTIQTSNGGASPPHMIASNEDHMNQANNNAGLNLSMTAAELRAKLAAKKKFDPRKESIDFKKKFDVVQKL